MSDERMFQSLKREQSDVSNRPKIKDARREGTDEEIADQKTLETAIQKLLEKKMLPADLNQYELQMIWEADIEDLKIRLNLSSADDVEFLQSLCNDLFLYYDNYRYALKMDELLERQEKLIKKLKLQKQ